MVTIIGRGRTDNAVGKKTSRLIEIVGPAGSGKTTLACALAGRNRAIRILDPPYFRELIEFPFFMRNMLSLLPTLLRLYFIQDGQSPTRRHIVWMATLNGWFRRLDKIGNNHAINLLDQGPIFFMAEMFYLGPECFRGKKIRNWWEGVFKEWADTLGEIFYLDASDDQLLKRIRERSKSHPMKEESKSRFSDFAHEYRFAYERLISILTANNHNLKTVFFDTGRTSIDEMVNRILGESNLKHEEPVVSHPLSAGSN